MRFRLVACLLTAALVSVALGGVAAIPAPTNLSFFGGRLTWKDNSSVEDGFRVRASSAGAKLWDAVLPPNTTAVGVPLEAQADCVSRPGVTYEVVAFAGTTESQPALTNVVLDCVAATATPALSPSPGLPATGTGSESPEAGRGGLLLGALAVTGLIASVLRFAHRRS